MFAAAKARRGAAPGLMATALLLSAPARAQADAYAGTWRAGETRMDVAVQSWGPDCGPEPQSSRSNGGGKVEITQDGEQLTIHARGRQIRSNACWSPNPGLKRVSTTVDAGNWTTRCKTGPDDPRAEEGTYTLRAEGEGRLLYRDVSRYNWQLKESKCVATITTTQTLHHIEPAATEAAPREQARCEPGPPRRITLAPRRAEIELGDQVCFRTRILDGRRCPLRQAPRFTLEHSPALKGQLTGRCFRAGSSAAEAEGEFTVIARHGKLEARARVTVRAADLSPLLAKRLETGALTGFEQEGPQAATPSPAPAPTAAKIAAREVRDANRPPALIWALLGALMLLILAGIGLWLRNRSGAAGTAAAGEAARAAAGGEAPAALPASDAGARGPEPAAEAGQAWICPHCRQGFAPSVGRCPKDGTELMPYAEFAAAGREPQQAQRARCPRCGKGYPATTKFCVTDGSPLEPAT